MLTLSQAQLAAERIIPGDKFLDAVIIDNGRTYNILGSGASRRHKETYGTQLCPNQPNQEYILRIGDGPTSVALGCSIRELQFWGIPPQNNGNAKIGLEMVSWGDVLLEKVGFNHLDVGLMLRPTDDQRRCVGFGASKTYYTHCKTAIHIDLSASRTRACNELNRIYISQGCDVGVEFIDPGPHPFPITYFYCEGQNLAGAVQHKGIVEIDRMYCEQKQVDIDGDGDKDLRPAYAVLNGLVRLNHIENMHYLYLDYDGKFEVVDDRYRNEIVYIVLNADDPRLSQMIADWPPIRPVPRVLVVDEPWERGKMVSVRRP